jgi:NADH dehydrogenase
MAVFVTGASGFVGRELVRALLARGFGVRWLNGTGRPVPGANGRASSPGSLGDIASIERALSGADTILHLAAAANGFAPPELTRLNYRGTVNLVEAARRQGVKRVVLLSALGANPTKSTPLAYSKWLAEETIKRSGLDFTVLRSSVIVGAGDRLLDPLIRHLRRRPVLPLPGLGRIRIQPVWVGDVVRCLIACLDRRDSSGRAYAIGGPEVLTYRDLVQRLSKTLGTPRLFLPLPLFCYRRVMSRHHSHSFTMIMECSASGRDSVTPPDAVHQAFHFLPRPLEEVVPALPFRPGERPRSSR